MFERQGVTGGRAAVNSEALELYNKMLEKRKAQRGDTSVRSMTDDEKTAQMDVYEEVMEAFEEGAGGLIVHCPFCGEETFFKHPARDDTGNPIVMRCSTTPPYEKHRHCNEHNLWLGPDVGAALAAAAGGAGAGAGNEDDDAAVEMDDGEVSEIEDEEPGEVEEEEEKEEEGADAGAA